MKLDRFLGYVKLLAGPGVLVLAGLILVISPDTASALVGKVLGFGVMAVGIGFAVAAVSRRQVASGLVAAALLALGGWLVRHPLALASGLGRLLGVVLMLQGARDLFASQSRGGKLLAGVTAALGLILVLLPMTSSRLVFMALGAVLLVMGVAEGVARLRQRRLGSGGGSVIDAL